MELLFLALLVFLMALALGSGYPVAFALPGSAIVTVAIAALCGYVATGNPDAYFSHGGPWQWLSAGVTNLRGVYWEVERDTLIAIPLFIFMGIMLQRSKIAEDLLVTMAQLFGPVPGGLGISVVFVGALLAATTGIVGATVVAMGLISLPAMLRNNYSKSLATGTIAASGTLGQIIPPSIVLIILADQLASAVDQAGTARKALHKAATGELSMPSSFGVVSTSAGEMFLGALVPGLLLVAIYMVFILIYALINPKVAPAVRGGTFDKAFFAKLALALFPPLGLIFLVLGSILAGIATVNQAGAIGAVGAIMMAGYRLKDGSKDAYAPVVLGLASLIGIMAVLLLFEPNVKAINTTRDALGVFLGVVATLGLIIAIGWSSWRAFKIENTLQEVMIETAKTTSLVFIILLGAAMLTAAFRAFGGEELVRDFLNGLPGGFWMKFTIVMAVIFVLGFFLDFIEIAVVVVPIVAPILLADPSANITAVWLGVMIGLNIQTSFLTPPFGFALFYLRGVAPPIVKTLDMYKGVIAFISLQLIALVVVGLYPPLVNYLPNRASLLSETAPPPRNPRLDYCVDKYIQDQFITQGVAINSAIAEARQLNLDYLPDRLKTNLEQSFDAAEEAPALMAQAWEADDRINDAVVDYLPVQQQVRRIEAEIREHDEEIRDLKTTIGRMRSEDQVAAKQKLQDKVAELEAERELLVAEIPADWKETYKSFKALLKEETILSGKFRRVAGDGYKPVAEIVATLKDNAAYAELQSGLMQIRSDLADADAEQLVASIEDLSSRAGNVEGASDIASGLSKVRRSLRNDTPDFEKAMEDMAEVVADYEAQLDWRNQAEINMLPTLERYEMAIRGTLGLREQRKLDDEQALFVASCQSDHRDVSHYF
ncbi:TRAP transporter large permease subunit [uncultured Sneathiella sp.]|jgi:tripartite ATP-independent transporter DctM subunit|uniref:TRAP transporter large permease n=1 Tax=uncultured Sneathiella sp. TaxID=879315 RepID=UPI0030DA31FC|tara:strand:- start:1353 stop:4007 length:2655 start_codon:yes stop_codon:yes gene_type:complete